MKGFDLPSFLTGLLAGTFFGLIVAPALADTAAEGAIFRACAVQARDHGDQAAEELFREAARAIGGTSLLPATVQPSRSRCLGMQATAEIYRPVEQKEREWPRF